MMRAFTAMARMGLTAVLLLLATHAWSQTDTKVTYNNAGVPAISKSDAPLERQMPPRQGSAVESSGTMHIDGVEVPVAQVQKPAVQADQVGKPADQQAMRTYIKHFHAWMQAKPDYRSELSDVEIRMVEGKHWDALYLHALREAQHRNNR